MAPNALLPALFVPLILFALYRRVRRTFGRQPIRRNRMLVRIGLLCVVLALFVVPTLSRMDLAAGAVGGAMIGAALGVLGLRLTRFEITPDGQEFYIPNSYIGAGLTAILAARLVYRFVSMDPMMAASAQQAPLDPLNAVHGSPLTLGIVTLLLGYYLAYFVGILREGKKHGVA
jgi:hypothetical protein